MKRSLPFQPRRAAVDAAERATKLSLASIDSRRRCRDGWGPQPDLLLLQGTAAAVARRNMADWPKEFESFGFLHSRIPSPKPSGSHSPRPSTKTSPTGSFPGRVRAARSDAGNCRWCSGSEGQCLAFEAEGDSTRGFATSRTAGYARLCQSHHCVGVPALKPKTTDPFAPVPKAVPLALAITHRPEMDKNSNTNLQALCRPKGPPRKQSGSLFIHATGSLIGSRSKRNSPPSQAASVSCLCLCAMLKYLLESLYLPRNPGKV